MTYAADLELALAMADAADTLSMRHYRSKDLVITTKPDATPVTEADHAVEKLLRETLGSQRPQDAIVGEEFGGDANLPGRRWIVDPIDGTKNYLRGVPVWSTLIALVVDDEYAVGVVSAPAMGRRWWAAKGSGAWTREVNGDVNRIQVSGVSAMSDASFSFSDSVDWDRHSASAGCLQRFVDSTWRQRAYGDFYSHMLVAEGAIDIGAEPTLAAWDMAALIPIVQEAGGRITGYRGGDPLAETSCLTTNGALHDAALALIAK